MDTEDNKDLMVAEPQNRRSFPESSGGELPIDQENLPG